MPTAPMDPDLERRTRALLDRVASGEITMEGFMHAMIEVFAEHKGLLPSAEEPLAEAVVEAPPAEPNVRAPPEVDWEILLACPPPARHPRDPDPDDDTF